MPNFALGETDEGFRWLEKCYEERIPHLLTLKADPIFDPIRSDPRYRDLLRRIGLRVKDATVQPPFHIGNRANIAGNDIGEMAFVELQSLGRSVINAVNDWFRLIEQQVNKG